MDLMNLSSYAKDNQGVKWMFFINAQTKYLRILLMKTKSGKETSKALYDILSGIKGLKDAKCDQPGEKGTLCKDLCKEQ